jgi:hypothetical protein
MVVRDCVAAWQVHDMPTEDEEEEEEEEEERGRDNFY